MQELMFDFQKFNDEGFIVHPEVSFEKSRECFDEGESGTLKISEIIKHRRKLISGAPVAEIRFEVFDNADFRNSGNSMCRAANNVSDDCRRAISALINYASGNYSEDESGDCGLELLDLRQRDYIQSCFDENDGMHKSKRERASCTVNISFFYIYPDFQNTEIAVYVLENLSSIMKQYFNSYPYYAVIAPQPYMLVVKGKKVRWELNKDFVEKAEMMDMLEANGFIEIGGGCFARNYGKEEICLC